MSCLLHLFQNAQIYLFSIMRRHFRSLITFTVLCVISGSTSCIKGGVQDWNHATIYLWPCQGFINTFSIFCSCPNILNILFAYLVAAEHWIDFFRELPRMTLNDNSQFKGHHCVRAQHHAHHSLLQMQILQKQKWLQDLFYLNDLIHPHWNEGHKNMKILVHSSS